MSVQKLTQALSDMKCGVGMNDSLFLFMHCLLSQQLTFCFTRIT